MIEEQIIFNEIRNNASLVCRDDCVGADLAAAVGVAVTHKMKSVCVAPNRVVEVWPWLEKTKIKIISRFYVNKAINDDFMSDLSGQISGSFRDGANGAMVFIHMRDLPKFAAEIVSIRDDLFFNKSFNIAIDINEIGVFDWPELFGILRVVYADSLVLTFDNDEGDKSDFVGRVFAMLNAPHGNWTGVVNFMLGNNTVRMDQAYRLVEKMMPEVVSRTEFFIDN